MEENLKNKIQELFETTPEGVGVMFGNKIKGGEYTDEESIIFTVEKKKPLSELSVDEILPSQIEVDGKIYKTDVFESGIIEAYACPSNTLQSCYSWKNTTPQNRSTIRPIKGGVSTTSTNQQGYVGTLGFLALDSATGALVGITNNHVVIGNAFYANYNSPTGLIQNESNDNVYQTGEIQPSPISLKIGEVLRYVPLFEPPLYNQVDGAMVSISQSVMSDSESCKQLGLSGNTFLPFATTNELNNLLGNTQVSSSGRSTGVKQGSTCGLKIQGTSFITGVTGYKKQGNPVTAYFDNCISFTRLNPDCPNPIYPGDSGSALVATIGGVDKIIGLCFAGSEYLGVACRIDYVANQLGIQQWDCTTPNFVDLNSKKFVTVSGLSSEKTIECSGQTLWQIGIIKDTINC